MNPAQRALWYVESHLAEPMTLDEIAAISGVSRFHIVRAFAAATGLPVMRYVRARRLTEGGAQSCERRAGHPVAGAGGGLRLARSIHPRVPRPVRHHARSGAGRNVPRQSQASGADPHGLHHLDHSPAAFRNRKGLLVAGLNERISCDNGAAIPGLWHRFHQEVADIPARVGTVAYGVCCNGDDSGNFDYIAGVEVADFSDLPRRFGRIRIPEQRYAVFTHAEHVASIRRTVNTIWNQWLPASGLKAADAPNFERYDEKFDPATGNGGLEIWIPGRTELRAKCAFSATLAYAICHRACLASPGDFVITARSILRVGPVPDIPCKP